MASLKQTLLQPRKDVDMTEGSIVRHLITFSIPLLLGNIFQQLYNTVDAWVVGNFVSDEAFAAVGTVGPIINMLIGFFLGLSSGAGVVISQYYGAKQYEKVSSTVHTAITMTIILGMVFTGAGIAMTPTMLTLTNTDPEVIPESKAYLIIYFAGVLGLMIYNIGAGILRAVGDSRRPFYYLVASTLTNIVLDFVFVLGLGMGVRGVALATVIAQGVSATLTIITLMRSDTCIRLEMGKLKPDFAMLGKIFRVGLPAALQMTVTSFSNVFVQSYINGYGKAYMGGWTAYTKLDQVIFLPMQSISLAATTFVGQNLGMRNVERAKKGVSQGLAIAMTGTVLIMIPVIAFAPHLVRFFNDNAEVVEIGTLLLRYITPFYVLCCINQIYAGALRGAGNSKVPMIIMLSSFVLFRQIYLIVMSNFICSDFLAIAMGYPAGWLVCSAVTLIYYKRVNLEKSRLV
ncbi:MAG: MATE family efflux transporter [Ruminococcaceae bacterium]|nr:MATE family efflux transporter [Oscillospiraceae bacterium]